MCNGCYYYLLASSEAATAQMVRNIIQSASRLARSLGDHSRAARRED